MAKLGATPFFLDFDKANQCAAGSGLGDGTTIVKQVLGSTAVPVMRRICATYLSVGSAFA
jgi:hypothetical protein